MSRAVDSFLRPSLMALAVALAIPLGSPAVQAAEQTALRTYDLPSAPLASTLNQIASQAGIALALDPALVDGRTSARVSGQYDALGALHAAARHRLATAAKQRRQLQPGGHPDGTLALPETAIHASGDLETAWGPVEGYTATRTAAGTKTDTALVEVPVPSPSRPVSR